MIDKFQVATARAERAEAALRDLVEVAQDSWFDDDGTDSDDAAGGHAARCRHPRRHTGGWGMIRWREPQYKADRRVAMSGDVAIGAVFPPGSGKKWRWLLWVTGGPEKEGAMTTELAAKYALLSAWHDFLAAAALSPEAHGNTAQIDAWRRPPRYIEPNPEREGQLSRAMSQALADLSKRVGVPANQLQKDAMIHGIGVTRDGTRIAPEEFYEPAGKEARTHIVRRGDTLYSLAQRYLGDGDRWTDIYRLNAGLIDAELRGRGLCHRSARDTLDSYAPHLWIFPGQVLTLPKAASPNRDSQQ